MPSLADPGGEKKNMSKSEELRVLFVFSPLDFPPPDSEVGSERYLAWEQDEVQLPWRAA